MKNKTLAVVTTLIVAVILLISFAMARAEYGYSTGLQDGIRIGYLATTNSNGRSTLFVGLTQPTSISSHCWVGTLHGRHVGYALAAIVKFITPKSAHAAEYVQGYYRQDGTYVQGYYRTEADGNPYNNYNQPAPMDMRSPTTPGGYGSNPGYAPRIPNGGAAPRGGYDSNR